MERVFEEELERERERGGGGASEILCLSDRQTNE